MGSRFDGHPVLDEDQRRGLPPPMIAKQTPTKERFVPVLSRETPRELHDDLAATGPEGRGPSSSTSAAYTAARRAAAMVDFSISVDADVIAGPAR